MAVAYALPGWGTAPSRMEPMCVALRSHGVDASPWAYDATGSIDRIGGLLAEQVAAAAQDGPVHLVGHSLGGLASASAVLDHGADVATVTTINTPWRGTWVAWTADQDEALGPQLRWGADRLDELRAALRAHLRRPIGPRWSVVGAVLDLATTPATSVRVPTGGRLETSLVPVAGHSISLLHRRMIDHVVRSVTTPVAG